MCNDSENAAASEFEKNGCIIGKNYKLLKNYFDKNNTVPERAIEDAYFTNERIHKFDTSIISNMKISQSIFSNMGLDGLIFKDLNFQHNTFINCYFKGSSFYNVNFTGCKFINCNFDDVILFSCDFKYARFDKCFIQYKRIKQTLPQEHNLKWQLCINMYIESKNLGSYYDYKKYYFASKNASCEYEIKKAFHKNHEKVYYEKYTWIEKFDGVLNFIRLKVENIIWGYGESITKLLISAFVVMLFFALLILFKSNMNFTMSFQQSIMYFIGLGTVISTVEKSLILIMIIERFSGLLYIGMFISAMYKYINRG